MMKPKAKEMPRRSALATAGTALPASTRVATTDPGPTSTRAAVPSVSARAFCALLYISTSSVERDSTLSNRFQHTVRLSFGVVNQSIGPKGWFQATTTFTGSYRRDWRRIGSPSGSRRLNSDGGDLDDKSECRGDWEDGG